MNAKTAEQIGREAFEAGKGNFPFADLRIAAEMKNAAVGSKTSILKAFNKGWTAANLAS